MNPPTVIIPIPSHDFDPTEVSVSWKILRDAGCRVEFATPDGQRGYADPLMISGQGLDPWGWIPGLKAIRLVGLLLRADRHGREAYRQLQQDSAFLAPRRYAELKPDDYDGLLLPGGHAPRMKAYLEDRRLQAFVAAFFESVDHAGQAKPIAAVCHGVVLAARSISPRTGKSVLHGRKTTALTWQLERSAWQLTRFFARFWDPGYYRTYGEAPGQPVGYCSVESEVKRALANDADFIDVPKGSADFLLKTSGIARDRLDNPRPAWVVQDGNYLSARWPGDVHTFAQAFAERLLARGGR
ncbi:type 1 glutamine amidotransferase domain-containing protein [Chitinivorax sp. PXF-14]|uniref:type 1 glutamine amidotransferase domain-containing protein n=1 Tax=Chitinivorax sp. PXF-14 TaxID=3230488 RepID=UPI0034655C6C